MSKEDYRDVLQRIIESGNLKSHEEIDNIIGPPPVNDIQNKLFRWQFDKDDAKNIINIYERFIDKNINYRTLNKLKDDLINEGKEIEKKGVYPIEVILYTSKIINYRLKDVYLVETLSDVIGYFIKKDSIKAKETLEHIIKNWTWVEQLKISILSLNFIDEFELLSLIYDEYRSNISLKYEVFKTLLDSRNDKCIEMILNIVSYLDSDFECDRRISVLFKDKYDIYYPLEGLKRAHELYNCGSNISFFGRKILGKILGKTVDIDIIDKGGPDLPTMIKVAKESFSNNKKLFETEFLKGGRQRKNSIIAMGHSHDKNEVEDFLYNLYRENKSNLTIYESMNISITLAKCNSEKCLNICKDNKKDSRFKPYEYACRFLLGEELAGELLAHELIVGKYCKENTITMKAVKPCLFKNTLSKIIEDEFSKLVDDCSENDLINYLINIESFLISNSKSPSIIIELQKICGYKSKEANSYKLFRESEKLQNVFMNIMVDLVNVDTINIYEKMIFSIANNNSLNKKIRIKARNIVSDLVDIKPPTV